MRERFIVLISPQLAYCELIISFSYKIEFTLPKKYDLICEKMIESFDLDKKENEEKIPRLISILFRKVSI